MNKPIKLTFLLMLACLMLLPVNAQNTPEWQSQYAVGLNKLAPHTYVWPYASATDVKKGDYEQSPYYLSLNGKWKFHWVKNPDLRPKDFYKPSFYTGGWADINVPGNWERQGYGTAIYVNETYEFDDKMFNFKKNPPLVPYKENEVGSYRRTFTVPAGWRPPGSTLLRRCDFFLLCVGERTSSRLQPRLQDSCRMGYHRSVGRR